MHFLKLSRRSILAGMGASVALLPKAVFAQDAPPRRLVLMYSGNGQHPATWSASGSGTSFSLGASLSPLNRLRSQIAVVDGIQVRSFLAEEHPDGTVTALTGTPTAEAVEEIGTSISIDQVIGAANTPPGGFATVHLAAWVSGELPAYTFTEGGGRVTLERSPSAAYNSLFRDFSLPDTRDPDEEEPDRRTLMRRHVVDRVNRDFSRVRDQLGVEDRQIIERHLESLDQLARRLGVGGSGFITDACDPTNPGDGGDGVSDDEVAARGRAHAQVLAMAMACDRTRVGSIAMGLSSAGLSGHHDASHSFDYDACTGYDQFFANRFADVIDAFADVGLLDNTLLVWFNELGKFKLPGGEADHGLDDVGYVLAGSLAQTNRYHRIAGQPNHQYFLAGILQQFGQDVDFFGDSNYRQSGQSAIVSPFAS